MLHDLILLRLLKDPIQYLTAFDFALTEQVQSLEYAETRTDQKYYIGRLTRSTIIPSFLDLTSVIFH